MPSSLYKNARKNLGSKETSRLNRFLQWLESISEQSVDGGQLSENIQGESHLVGDARFGDSGELIDFLRECGTSHQGTHSQESEAYTASCGRFELKGLRIPASDIPKRILRYSTSRTLIASIIEMILGTIARREFDGGQMSPADAFIRLARMWNFSLVSSENLARGNAVFATFETEQSAPREDAGGMAEVLALPICLRVGAGDQILFELSYDRDVVANYRFPTVADAGFMHLFRPAEELQPAASDTNSLYGWTHPLNRAAPQPEIVHENASLQVVREAPRLVGSMTL
jgi:hypothetical protein